MSKPSEGAYTMPTLTPTVAENSATDNTPPSRTLVPGHFFCVNDAMIRWRLVLSHPASAVYDLLCWHIAKETQQWTISQKQMARELHISERWVRIGTTELERFALIEVQRHQRSVNSYRLLEVPP